MVILELIIASQFKKIKKFGKKVGIDFDRLRPTKEDLKEMKKRFDRIGGV